MTPDYEVVWSGATHRQFAQPVTAAPSRSHYRAPENHPRFLAGLRTRAKVRALLTDQWISQGSLAELTGVTVTAIRAHLRAALADGYAEKRESHAATRQNGEPVCTYRRRQTQREAA